MDPQPSDAEGKEGNSFEKVARDDEAFREAAAKETINPAAEVAALSALFQPALCSICAKTLGSRWATVLSKYKTVADMPDSELASAIVGVVETLDARHLLPSGIKKRLEEGINPACFGLATLIDNLHKE
eukprot:m.459993 g.459993  ORF g.459993 m.459993 type:complete len:129 (-) comp21889_c0_seq1:137-523(-)